jgi:hypothetical protein
MIVEGPLAVTAKVAFTGEGGYDECDEREECCERDGEGAECVAPFGLQMPVAGTGGCETMRRFSASRMTLSKSQERQSRTGEASNGGRKSLTTLEDEDLKEGRCESSRPFTGYEYAETNLPSANEPFDIVSGTHSHCTSSTFPSQRFKLIPTIVQPVPDGTHTLLVDPGSLVRQPTCLRSSQQCVRPPANGAEVQREAEEVCTEEIRGLRRLRRSKVAGMF